MEKQTQYINKSFNTKLFKGEPSDQLYTWVNAAISDGFRLVTVTETIDNQNKRTFTAHMVR